MNRQLAALAAATLVSIGLLAACSQTRSGMDTSLTVDVAKSDTQDVEDRIIDQLPEGVVATVDQQKKGSSRLRV
jgi:hypothetical protein